jgi:hypothetical protein
MNSLSVFNGCEMVLDSANVIAAEDADDSAASDQLQTEAKNKAQARSSAAAVIDLSELNRELHSSVSGGWKQWCALPLCPTLQALMQRLEDITADPSSSSSSSSAAAQPQSQAQKGAANESEAEAAADESDAEGDESAGFGLVMDEKELAEAAEQEERVFEDVRDTGIGCVLTHSVVGSLMRCVVCGVWCVQVWRTQVLRWTSRSIKRCPLPPPPLRRLLPPPPPPQPHVQAQVWV